MEEKSIFIQLASVNHSYWERIEEAMKLYGREQVAEIIDEYCQFLCDAHKELMMRANRLEELIQKHNISGEGKDRFIEVSKSIRDFANLFMEGYRRMEKDQREGKFPTNLPDFSDLIRPN